MRRMMLDMSQEKLGRTLGLSFQQVQKYEKGTNRISASRLLQFSGILHAPVAFFFEGAPATEGQSDRPRAAPMPAHVSEFLATSDGLSLAKAFMHIEHSTIRQRIVALVKGLAGRAD